MTEEEKTLFMDWKIKNKDNIENVVITLLNYEKGVDTKTCYDEVDFLIRKAFLAGLKAGKPKWHKVADGDLPSPNVRVDVWMKLSKNYETKYIAYWRPTIKQWQIYNLFEASRQLKDEDFLDENEVIAWQEIVLPDSPDDDFCGT